MSGGAADVARALQGVFDPALYRREVAVPEGEDPLLHYVDRGVGRPNVIFDRDWYVARNPEADAPGGAALLHYVRVGEPAGLDPSPLFDAGWYRLRYGVAAPLAHYLANRFGAFSPVPQFDAAYYLKANPDVGAAGVDPFQHYLHFGFREYRKPFAGFNPRLYARRHRIGDMNPVAHMRARGVSADPAASGPSAFAEIKAFARPGPRFEPQAPSPDGEPRALALAFHLTQFHAIPENDAWWGEGFTEWVNLARGAPRFQGHYQPRLPGRLGFYDLSDPETLRAQARLARAGIGGFVFYFYDFDGRRLLEKPLELFLAAPDIDIGFCLMWANENWTRRWDGADEDVLIAQSYDERSETARCAEFARHFRDPRYIRLEGRPLLMVYRASLIPDTAAALARWRRQFADLGETPLFIMAQTFADVDPRPLGFDAAIEFPPHKLTRGLPQIYDSLDIFDEAFEADAFAYDDLVAASLAEPAPDFPLIKTVTPSWDNDARRQGQGLTVVGATPGKYRRWLAELIARAAPWRGARLVAINAWNEWSEGAYLEPDAHFGWAYLNATARALIGAPPPPAHLALGHARFAPTARRLAAEFGLRVASEGAGLPVLSEAAQNEAAARALFARLLPGVAKVSVALLRRGAGIAQALAAVFAQTHPVWETLVLDPDGGGLDEVDAALRAADREATLVVDAPADWRRAAELASGEWLWIVESGDRPDPALLQSLAPALGADVALALCDGAALGAPTRPTPLHPPRRLAHFHDGAFAAADFAGRFLADAAPIASFGAALWRREALLALEAAADADANALARALATQPGRVRHVAETLAFRAG